MDITFAPGGLLQIDDAEIIYRNFTGVGSKFNREGDRNFSVLVRNEDDADALIEAGWNVKIKKDEEGMVVRMHLPVKIKFNDRGPNVYLRTGARLVELNEDTIECLDHIDILGVDLDIRPYDWEVNGKTGRTAYLQGIRVTQKVDRFAEDM